MEAYLDIVKQVFEKGSYVKHKRTGSGTQAISSAEFKHDMKDGFPLLTTKKMAFKSARVELEGFINGITDKKWFQDRNCKIWNEWCNPQKVPYGNDEETKQKMFQERDLGPIYGFQWRHAGAEYKGYDQDYSGQGKDQLADLINTLKTNPTSRRMMVNSWNSNDLDKMALPPCHYNFGVNIIDNKLNLTWDQRSVDSMLGLPFNIVSYGLLLHLLAKESGYEEGELKGSLKNVHIYEGHFENALEQLSRAPYKLPTISTETSSTLDWKHNDIKVHDYVSHPELKYEIVV